MFRQDVLVACSTTAHIPIIPNDLKETLGDEHFILRGRGGERGGGRQYHFNRTSFKSLMVRFHNDSLMKLKVVEDEEKSAVPQNIHNKKIKQNGSH